MKRKISGICIVAVLLAIMSAGTFAYYTAEDSARSVITSGSLEMTIIETTADGKAFPKEGVFVMPGDTVSKIVTVENSGQQPFYIRAQLVKAVEDSPLSAEMCLKPNIDGEHWLSKDGYYYYHTALAPGETTLPLFTQVEIDGKSVNNSHLGKTLLLEINAQAVQSEHNGSSVLEAVGWPETE